MKFKVTKSDIYIRVAPIKGVIDGCPYLDFRIERFKNLIKLLEVFLSYKGKRKELKIKRGNIRSCKVVGYIKNNGKTLILGEDYLDIGDNGEIIDKLYAMTLSRSDVEEIYEKLKLIEIEQCLS